MKRNFYTRDDIIALIAQGKLRDARKIRNTLIKPLQEAKKIITNRKSATYIGILRDIKDLNKLTRPNTAIFKSIMKNSSSIATKNAIEALKRRIKRFERRGILLNLSELTIDETSVEEYVKSIGNKNAPAKIRYKMQSKLNKSLKKLDAIKLGKNQSIRIFKGDISKIKVRKGVATSWTRDRKFAGDKRTITTVGKSKVEWIYHQSERNLSIYEANWLVVGTVDQASMHGYKLYVQAFGSDSRDVYSYGEAMVIPYIAFLQRDAIDYE